VKAARAAPREPWQATSGDGETGAGSARSLPRRVAWADLPPAIATRLAAEGVTSLADWRALGRRRLQIFGVTRAMVAQLDELEP
jgi:hypothetical protein